MDTDANVQCCCMGAAAMDSGLGEPESKQPALLDGWKFTDEQRDFIKSLKEDDEEEA